MFELILKGEKGMKSKRRLLLAALLMVILTVLLAVPVLAKPKLDEKKDEKSNLQLHAAISVMNGKYADIYLPQDHATYHQGDIFKYHFSVQDTWSTLYTRALFGIMDEEGNFQFFNYTEVIPKNSTKEFSGEVLTNDIPVGKYTFGVCNYCFEDAAGNRESWRVNVDDLPYVEVEIEILPPLPPEPAPEPEPTPEPVSSPGADTIQRETPSIFNVKAKKNRIFVFWEKVKTPTQMKSIEIEYATNPKFTKNVSIVSVNPNKTRTTLKLKRKKTYYIRIRYKWSDGVSAWSANKKVRTK